MRKRKRKKSNKKIIILLLIIIFLLVVFFLNNNSNSNLKVVSVVEEIDTYNYILDNNQTRIYKKYFNKLKQELKDGKIDEENYAKLISYLFTIDYYTLNNKVTNQDIGGVMFIHSNIKDKFLSDSINGVYKYLKNNLYNNRKQELPEVNNIDVLEFTKIKYDYNNLYDDNAFYVKLKVGYVKKMGYPEEVNIKIIHEENKLSIVEIY